MYIPDSFLFVFLIFFIYKDRNLSSQSAYCKAFIAHAQILEKYLLIF